MFDAAGNIVLNHILNTRSSSQSSSTTGGGFTMPVPGMSAGGLPTINFHYNNASSTSDTGAALNTNFSSGTNSVTLTAGGEVIRTDGTGWSRETSEQSGINLSFDLNTVFDVMKNLKSGVKLAGLGEGVFDPIRYMREASQEHAMKQLLTADEAALTNLWEEVAVRGLSAGAANFLAHGPFDGAWTSTAGNHLLKPLAHGAAQGGIAELFGKDFMTGFAGGATSSFVGALLGANQGLGDNRIGDGALVDLGAQFGALGSFAVTGDGAFGALIGRSVLQANDRADLAVYISALTPDQKRALLALLGSELDPSTVTAMEEAIRTGNYESLLEGSMNLSSVAEVVSKFSGHLGDGNLFALSPETERILREAIRQANLNTWDLGAYKSPNDLAYTSALDLYNTQNSIARQLVRGVDPFRLLGMKPEVENSPPRHADDNRINLWDHSLIGPTARILDSGLEFDPTNNYSGTMRETVDDFFTLTDAAGGVGLAGGVDVEGEVFSAVGRAVSSGAGAFSSALRNAGNAMKIRLFGGDGLQVTGTRFGMFGGGSTFGPGTKVKHTFTDATELRKATDAPEPSSIYEFDGFQWQTDATGRVNNAKATIEIKPHGRQGAGLQTQIGHEGDANDVGFHIFGDIFGGPVNRLNIIPADKTINNGAYKAIENQLKAAASEGRKVEVNFKPYYDGANKTNRPDAFRISWKIEGQRAQSMEFENLPPD